MKSVMKELCARALRDQRREQRRLLDPQRAEAHSLEDVTPVLHIGLPQHPPDKEMAADAGGGDSSLQRCVGLFQEGSHWKQLEEGVWWRPSEVWNASPDNREPVGALRQGVNQDMLTRNTSGRNADDGFREWGVGKNWWGEKQTAFSLCFLPESMKIILGCHVVVRSNLDMLWEGQTDSTYEVPFDTHHMTLGTGWLMLQGQLSCAGHRHYACIKHSEKMQWPCWQILHVEASSFSIHLCSNVTLDCFKVTIPVAALLKLSDKVWIC